MTMTSKEKFDELSELLHNNVLEVTFTKTNGDRRVMRCTLKEDLLEPKPGVTIVEPKPVQTNFETIKVFDLDKSAWRSFRIASVLEKKLL